MQSSPGWHSIDRWFEWVMASIILATGIYVAIYPESLEQSRMNAVLDFVWIQLFCVAYILVGVMRIAGLYWVGKLRGIEYHLRAAGALITGINWAWMGFALRIYSQETSMATSQATCVYMGLAIGEFMSIFRALTDGKHTSS